jgi:hypothetical protein
MKGSLKRGMDPVPFEIARRTANPHPGRFRNGTGGGTTDVPKEEK